MLPKYRPLFVLLLLLCGCAVANKVGEQSARQTQLSERLDALMGQSKDNVLPAMESMRFGEPDTIETAADGREMYTYSREEAAGFDKIELFFKNSILDGKSVYSCSNRASCEGLQDLL